MRHTGTSRIHHGGGSFNSFGISLSRKMKMEVEEVQIYILGYRL